MKKITRSTPIRCYAIGPEYVAITVNARARWKIAAWGSRAEILARCPGATLPAKADPKMDDYHAFREELLR